MRAPLRCNAAYQSRRRKRGFRKQRAASRPAERGEHLCAACRGRCGLQNAAGCCCTAACMPPSAVWVWDSHIAALSADTLAAHGKVRARGRAVPERGRRNVDVALCTGGGVHGCSRVHIKMMNYFWHRWSSVLPSMCFCAPLSKLLFRVVWRGMQAGRHASDADAPHPAQRSAAAHGQASMEYLMPRYNLRSAL